MQAWKKRYLHNPLSFALEWFFSLPSYLLQQNYFLDFTHFNIEELDLTDQRFFWNRNVVNWRRTIFCYELYVFLSVVRSYVISRFLGKKMVMLLPTQRVFSNFSCRFLNTNIFSNLNSNCSNLLDRRNLQEQVKKAFWIPKIVLTLHCVNRLF